MRALILSTLLLTACASTPVNPPEIKYDPSWPMPIKVCPISWVVLEVEGAPYVALTYNDNVQGAICNEDTARYIRQLKEMVCSYRKHLKDPMCLKELNDR